MCKILFLIFLLLAVSFADSGEDGEDGEKCADHEENVWVLDSITTDGEKVDLSSKNLWYATDNVTATYTDGCRECTYNVAHVISSYDLITFSDGECTKPASDCADGSILVEFTSTMCFNNSVDYLDISVDDKNISYIPKDLLIVHDTVWALYLIKDGEDNESWLPDHSEYLDMTKDGIWEYVDENSIYYGTLTIDDHCISDMILKDDSVKILESFGNYENLYVSKIKWDEINKFHITGLDNLYLYGTTETY